MTTHSRITDYNLITGTSLKGYTGTTRRRLEEVFGPPDVDLGEDKIRCHWAIMFTYRDGSTSVATIYDWKEYRDIRMDEIYYWHIGANDIFTVGEVQALISG
jgi:hypothetical protein